MKHTKGPWLASAGDIYGAESDDRVAEVNPDSGNSKWIYDAALIASAPELYSALKDLVRYMKFIEPNNTTELELAEYALKKAEGKE